MGFFFWKQTARMKPPFDIAGDLDTPVSAYTKLSAFRPLLPARERGGRRAARPLLFHRFRRRARGAPGRARVCRSASRQLPAPRTARRSCSPRCARRWLPPRARCRSSIRCRWPADWSGFTAYDVVRYFERLPNLAAPPADAPPLLHYVAPRSLLVFDHLTRAHRLAACRVSAAERAGTAPRDHPGAARTGALRAASAPGGYRPPTRGFEPRRRTSPACGARRNTSPPVMSTSWCCRRASPAGTSSTRSRPIARCG